jgi:hypothetical protein
MRKHYCKKTHNLRNGESFKFMEDQTNYVVVDDIYYSKVGYKKKILLPFDIKVRTFKTI